MFIADREAKCSRPRCSLAGHEVFSQRQTASSSARWSAAPHRGHSLGICHGSRIRRPPAQDRADDARDDVARLLDQDPVAFADVLPRDVVGVVQRRHRDGRAGDEHRLEHGERRDRAGPADVHFDLLQERRLLLRRELERDRPARELAGGAEEPPLGELIDLDHHAVGIELERAPLLRPFGAESHQRVDAGAPPPVRFDGKAGGAQLFQRFACVCRRT